VGEVSDRDPHAGFTKKNGKTSFGYEAHIGTDEGSNLIRRAVMTTAQLHDSQAVNGGVKSGLGAVLKSASSGLAVTRAMGRRPVSGALQIVGG
jgi:hypothetical protein